MTFTQMLTEWIFGPNVIAMCDHLEQSNCIQGIIINGLDQLLNRVIIVSLVAGIITGICMSLWLFVILKVF